MEFLGCNERFRVLMCGRRWGKSLISQSESVKGMLAGESIAYITPTYMLAKHFFEEIIERLPKDVYNANKSDLLIEMITGGYVQFFTGERLDSLRGRKFHKVIVDEGSYIPKLQEGWNNSIRPTLSDYQGKAIFLSTPKGKNYFYNLFMRGKNAEPDWASFHFSTYTNPYIPKSEVDAAKMELPEAVFNQEYMAEPSENADNPFGIQMIQQCIYPMSREKVVCYGIDLAKSVDWTVIIGIDKNGNVCYFDRFQKDWRSTIEHIKGLVPAPILVDSTGVGDPIAEELQRVGLMVEGLKFTAHTKQQLMEGLSSAIHQRKITYPQGPIVSELEIFEYQYTNRGVRYSAPEGFHDDCVMGLALAWQNYSKNNRTGKYSFI